jgi:phage-related protein
MLLIEQSDGELVPLDSTFVLRELELRSTDSIESAAMQHGGKDLSLGFFDPRRVSLLGFIPTPTRQDYDSVFETYMRLFRQRNLKLFRGEPIDRYLLLTRLLSTRSQFVDGTDYAGQLELEFVCENPFWQDVVEISEIRTLVDGQYFSLFNPGNVECYPVITIAGLTAVSFPYLAFTNITDGNQRLVYTDTAVTLGNTVIFDSVAGTVVRGDTNTARYMTGSFLKLLSGVNTLQYNGASVSYSYHARPQYL